MAARIPEEEMNNNIFHVLHEINRKLLLAQIGCRPKAKKLIDEIVDTELKQVETYIHDKESKSL